MSEKRKNQTKRNSSIAFGLVISALFLYLSLRDLDWSLFYSQLTSLKWPHLLGLFVIMWVCVGLRALRWRLLLPGGAQMKFGIIYSTMWVGLAGIFLLPLRAGEFVRPWLISRSEKITFSGALASIVVERVVDILTLILCFVFLSGRLESSPDWVNAGAWGLGCVALLGLGFFVACYLLGDRMLGILDVLLSYLAFKIVRKYEQKILHLVSEFLLGLRAVAAFKSLAAVSALSLLIWLCIALFYYWGLLLMGVPASFEVGLTISIVIAFAVAAPSAPGFVGVFQFACVVALSAMSGYTKEFAVAYSVVMHIFQLVFTVAFGFFHMRKMGLNLHAVEDASHVALDA